MFCSECGAANRAGAKFCTECGTGLSRACPSCGTPADPGTKFCGECGTPLGRPEATAGTPVPAGGPVSERRLVSVVFVDLVGFTTFSEGRDPEEVREMLTRYAELMRQTAERYGGVVEKFIGDAVMAVWGTPIAREDDAERSTRAALEMLDSITSLGNEIGVPLAGRAGIYSGEAAVTVGASGESMVAGDMVNTAARLQSMADPGVVLTDRTTYLASRDAIAYEPVGELQLKGKEEAVEAWRALRVTGGAGGTRRDDPLEPPFTGRREDLRLLKDLLHATERESKARVASVIGVAGIGKSRLLWELYKYMDGLSESIWWHQGRSPSYGDGVAFWALAEMVRRRAGIAESDPSPVVADKLDACLEANLPNEDERAWMRGPLAHLLGVEDVQVEDTDILFSAWRTFFERLSQIHPVVMVFEDLHWADPGLIDFIEHMMAWSRNSPIYLVTLARPDLLEKRPTWGAGQRNFTSIHLEPLDDHEMTLLLKGVVDDLPGETSAQIVDRSGGVPLYAVEMMRKLLDARSIVSTEDGFQWVGGTSDVLVPETLHSLIASRLDSLPERDRLLVQDAAVLGQTFTADALSAITGTERSELDGRLEDLARREILAVDADPRSPERGQYGFVQSLIQEVAYQTLSNSDRSERHIKAAEYFTSLSELDHAEVVATHYLKAVENSRTGDAAAIAATARNAIREAAERANSLGSPRQAMDLFEKALAITTADADRAALLSEAGRSALKAGLVEAAIAHLQESVGVLSSEGKREELAASRVDLAGAHGLVGDFEKAKEILETAAAAIEDPEREAIGAGIFAELARAHVFSDGLEEAERYAHRAIPPAEHSGQTDIVVNVVITQGVLALYRGLFTESEILFRGARALAEERGLTFARLRAQLNLSALLPLTDPRRALEQGLEGLNDARSLGSSDNLPHFLVNTLDAALRLGDWDDCDAVVAQAEEFITDDLRFMVLPSLLALATYRGRTQQMAEYQAQLKQASSSAEWEVNGEIGLTTLAFVEGDRDGVESAQERVAKLQWLPETSEVVIFGALAGLWWNELDGARRALAALEKGPTRQGLIGVRFDTARGSVAALEGRLEDAASHFRTAIEKGTELGLGPDRAFAQMAMAIALGPEVAAKEFDDALRFFTEAGNTAFAGRIKERVANRS